MRSWQEAANGFPEIPKGKTVKEFWYNPAVRLSPSSRGGGGWGGWGGSQGGQRRPARLLSSCAAFPPGTDPPAVGCDRPRR